MVFLKAMKGKKLSTTLADESRPSDADHPGQRFLWHGIDKHEWELKMAKRQQLARKIIIDHLKDQRQVEEGVATKSVETNDYGDVILLTKFTAAVGIGGGLPIKLLEADRTTHLLRLAPNATERMTGINLGLDLAAKLDEINQAGN